MGEVIGTRSVDRRREVVAGPGPAMLLFGWLGVIALLLRPRLPSLPLRPGAIAGGPGEVLGDVRQRLGGPGQLTGPFATAGDGIAASGVVEVPGRFDVELRVGPAPVA